jgi:hypothetical protein
MGHFSNEHSFDKLSNSSTLNGNLFVGIEVDLSVFVLSQGDSEFSFDAVT